MVYVMNCDRLTPEHTCARFPELGVIHDKIICDLCQQHGGLQIPTVSIVETTRQLCRWMVDTGESVPDRPCKGHYILCTNPESSVYRTSDKERVNTSCNCTKARCNFFKGRESHGEQAT